MPPRTPPPSYASLPDGTPMKTHKPSVIFDEQEEDEDTLIVSDDRRRSSGATLVPQIPQYENSTAINWRFAAQGLNILQQAHREFASSQNSQDGTRTALTRHLYIHALTYLLRALPADLSPEEKYGLQASAPACIIKAPLEKNPPNLTIASQRTSVDQQRLQPTPTMVHRLTAFLVLHMILVIQLLLPWIKKLLTCSYRFERRHQITTRLVNTSVTAADRLGRKGLQLSQAVCQMEDGGVGNAISYMAVWWTRSVTGGMQEGLELGLRSLQSGMKDERIQIDTKI